MPQQDGPLGAGEAAEGNAFRRGRLSRRIEDRRNKATYCPDEAARGLWGAFVGTPPAGVIFYGHP